MARVTGARRYNNAALINVIDSIKPTCTAEWQRVVTRYQIDSLEPGKRQVKAIKRYFLHSLAKISEVKPTGKSAKAVLQRRCYEIYEDMLSKEEAQNIGAVSEDEELDEDAFLDYEEDDDDADTVVGFDIEQDDPQQPPAGTAAAAAAALAAPIMNLTQPYEAHATALPVDGNTVVNTPRSTVAPVNNRKHPIIATTATPKLPLRKKQKVAVTLPPAQEEEVACDDMKSKSARNAPRANAGAALNVMAEAMKQSSEAAKDSNANQILCQVLQSQQQQSQQTMMMMMMFMSSMMRGNTASSSSSADHVSSVDDSAMMKALFEKMLGNNTENKN
jgi:hypothetical protein